MSTDRVPLGIWITALVDAVAAAEPSAALRLATAVGALRARIGLDGDEAVVAVLAGRVVVLPADTEPVDGVGAASRAVVLAVLDGRLDASDAVRRGLIEAQGTVDGLGRIFQAIEIILDVATRAPALRVLAEQFRLEDPHPPRPHPPRTDDADEPALLAGLGLL